MKTKLVLAAAILTAFALGTFASDTYIHVHRPKNTPGELGVYCSNGGDPTVVGMEEKYLIVSCGTK
jgi:hypothetical protein